MVTTMQAGHFSRTALVMAFFRALESARPGSARLFSDPFAAHVLPLPARAIVSLARAPFLNFVIAALVDRRWPGARTSGVARTRLIDEWVTAAAQGGARQVVILGAGFDSRAWRLPALAGTRVFELDRPATSQEKYRRLIAARLDPSRIVQCAIDFDREALADTLVRHGFDRQTCTAVIWEGVTNYLTANAVESVLRWVGSLHAGSTLAFTYVHSRVLNETNTFEGAERVLTAVTNAGEAWTYGLDPAELSAHLRSCGLSLTEDLGADDYRHRYWPAADPHWHGYAFYRAALVSVAPHA
jgi:methyltransferase (TIGR00027 family)